MAPIHTNKKYAGNLKSRQARTQDRQSMNLKLARRSESHDDIRDQLVWQTTCLDQMDTAGSEHVRDDSDSGDSGICMSEDSIISTPSTYEIMDTSGDSIQPIKEDIENKYWIQESEIMDTSEHLIEPVKKDIKNYHWVEEREIMDKSQHLTEPVKKDINTHYWAEEYELTGRHHALCKEKEFLKWNCDEGLGIGDGIAQDLGKLSLAVQSAIIEPRTYIWHPNPLTGRGDYWDDQFSLSPSPEPIRPEFAVPARRNLPEVHAFTKGYGNTAYFTEKWSLNTSGLSPNPLLSLSGRRLAGPFYADAPVSIGFDAGKWIKSWCLCPNSVTCSCARGVSLISHETHTKRRMASTKKVHFAEPDVIRSTVSEKSTHTDKPSDIQEPEMLPCYFPPFQQPLEMRPVGLGLRSSLLPMLLPTYRAIGLRIAEREEGEIDTAKVFTAQIAAGYFASRKPLMLFASPVLCRLAFRDA